MLRGGRFGSCRRALRTSEGATPAQAFMYVSIGHDLVPQWIGLAQGRGFRSNRIARFSTKPLGPLLMEWQ